MVLRGILGVNEANSFMPFSIANMLKVAFFTAMRAGCTICRAGSVFRFMSFLSAEKWTGIEEFCRRAFLFEQLVALQGGLEFLDDPSVIAAN